MYTIEEINYDINEELNTLNFLGESMQSKRQQDIAKFSGLSCLSREPLIIISYAGLKFKSITENI